MSRLCVVIGGYLASLEGKECWFVEGGRGSVEAAVWLLVRSKAAGKKTLLHTGRLWPASGAPTEDQTGRWGDNRTQERGFEGLQARRVGSWTGYLYGEAVSHHHDDQRDEEGHKRTNEYEALLVEDTAAIDKNLVLVVETDHWDGHWHAWRETEQEVDV